MNRKLMMIAAGLVMTFALVTQVPAQSGQQPVDDHGNKGAQVDDRGKNKQPRPADDRNQKGPQPGDDRGKKGVIEQVLRLLGIIQETSN
ncbi:MAG TPA: hypothetical protein VFD58_01365 [Blastocatellia bacterium]|nr:hypothetical protein [Blastocatellia bacterium]